MKLEQVCRFRGEAGYHVCAQSPGFTAEQEVEMGKLFNDTMNPLFPKIGQSVFTCAMGETGSIFLSRSTLRSSGGRTTMFTHSYVLSAGDYEQAMEENSGAALLALPMEEMLYVQPPTDQLPTLEPVPAAAPDLNALREKYRLDDERYAQLLMGAYRAITTSGSLCLYTKRPLEETPTMVRELAYCIAEGLLPMLKGRLTYSSATDARMKVCVSSSAGGQAVGKPNIPFDVDQGLSVPKVKTDPMSHTFFLALAHAPSLERHAMLDKMQRWLSDLSDEGKGTSLGMVVAAYYLSSGQALHKEEAARLLASVLNSARGSGVNQQALDGVIARLMEILYQEGACPNALPQLVERCLLGASDYYDQALYSLLTLAPVFACADLIQTLIHLTDQRPPKIKPLVIRLLAHIPPDAEELDHLATDLIRWAAAQDVTELSDKCLALAERISDPNKKELVHTLLDEAGDQPLRMCESTILFSLLKHLGQTPDTRLDAPHCAMLDRRFPTLPREYQSLLLGYCLAVRIPAAPSSTALLQQIARDTPPFFSALAACLRNPQNRMIPVWEAYQAETLLKKGMDYSALAQVCNAENQFLNTGGPFEKQVVILWLACLDQELDPNDTMNHLVTVVSQSMDNLSQVRLSRELRAEAIEQAADLMWNHLSYRSILTAPISPPHALMVSRDPRAAKKLELLRRIQNFWRNCKDITPIADVFFDDQSPYTARDQNEIRTHLYDLNCYLLQEHRVFSWDLLILHSYAQDEDGDYYYDCRTVAEDVARMEAEGLIPPEVKAPLKHSSLLLEDEDLRKEMRKYITHKSPRILQELGEELKAESRMPWQKGGKPARESVPKAPAEEEAPVSTPSGESGGKSPLGFLQNLFGRRSSGDPPPTSSSGSIVFKDHSSGQNGRGRGKGGKRLK